MPYTIEIDEIVEVCYTGPFNEQEAFEGFAAVRVDPRLKTGMIHLVDLSRIDHFDMSIKSLKAFSLELQSHDFKLWGSVIVVVVKDDLTFGMTRMLQITSQSEGLKFEVFRSMSSAREWINTLRSHAADSKME